MRKQVEYTEEFKQELERRTIAYENGTEKLISATESKQRTEQLLIKIRNKSKLNNQYGIIS